VLGRGIKTSNSRYLPFAASQNLCFLLKKGLLKKKFMKPLTRTRWADSVSIAFMVHGCRSVYIIAWYASGPPGIPVLKTQNSPPRQGKNSRKFPFGKMLDFACSNTISTQTSNICLNHLQWYGQFAEVCMLLLVLSLEIYPDSNSFPSVPHAETDRQRSITVVSTNAPPSGQTSPGHCLPLEHLP